MAISKVIYDGETLIDLTGDTVAPEVLFQGYTATAANGEKIPGTAVIPTKVSQLENDAGYLTKSTVLNLIYPVGSIYMSVNSTSPETFLGGTWSRLQGRFLLGASSTYAAGDTGGSATHTLTTAQMPAHTHVQLGLDGGAANSSPARFTIQTDANAVIYTADGAIWASKTSSTAKKQYRTSTMNVDGDTGSTGGGEAHNNMPPYLSVYMWKRTA